MQINRRKRESPLDEFTPQEILIYYWWARRQRKHDYSAKKTDIYRDVANRFETDMAHVRAIFKKHHNVRMLRIEEYLWRTIQQYRFKLNWRDVKGRYITALKIKRNNMLAKSLKARRRHLKI